MNRIVLLMMICCISVWATAQKNAPKWMDKARRAVVKITVYDKNNRESGTGFGFFVSESGEVLSGYTLFKGAERAVVTDFEGKEYPVTHIIGADEMYDVIRVKTSPAKKPAVLVIASDLVAEGETVYQLSYSPGKEANYKPGKITESSKLKEVYGYYQVDIPLTPRQVNTPFVTSTGEVFGLAQEDASGKNEVSYGVSAAYTRSLEQTSLDIFNSAYRNIGIKKAWVPNVEDAKVSLFLLSGQLDAPAFLETVTDFIATFPTIPDGYQSRATLYATRGGELGGDAARYLELAKADLTKSVAVSTNKADALYEQAKQIYSVAITAEEEQTTDPFWTLDGALGVIQQAIGMEDKALYHQLEGDIYMYKGDFQDAYQSYMVVNNSELASPVSYYWAAKALENVTGANIGDMLVLLDKAVELSGTGPEAGPYLLERIDKRLMLNQYDEAIEDYDTYHYVVNGNVSDTFYYLREQVKFRKGDLEGALADIQEAIRMDSGNPDYYAEEASVYTRMQQYENALNSVGKALEIAPDFAACYRLQGVSYLRLEKKNEACEAFNKAKELGDPLADKLIRDNCQ